MQEDGIERDWRGADGKSTWVEIEGDSRQSLLFIE
jgi:hypothetical protein